MFLVRGLAGGCFSWPPAPTPPPPLVEPADASTAGGSRIGFDRSTTDAVADVFEEFEESVTDDSGRRWKWEAGFLDWGLSGGCSSPPPSRTPPPPLVELANARTAGWPRATFDRNGGISRLGFQRALLLPLPLLLPPSLLPPPLLLLPRPDLTPALPALGLPASPALPASQLAFPQPAKHKNIDLQGKLLDGLLLWERVG